MAENKVQITIEAIDKTKAALTGLQNDLKGVQTEGNKLPSVFSSMRTGFVAFTAAAATLAGVVSTLKAFVDEAAEAEQIENRLRFAMEGLGYSWENAKEAVDGYAESIQKATRFSDDEARKALTDMLMYTRDFAKAQNAATLAMDMSVRTGQDVGSTTRLIGMALSGNVEMLGRYIPEFRNLDAVLGENATAAEKAAYAMKVLQEKFGGTAKADIESYAGKVKQFENSWAELKETLGMKLLPTLKETFDWLKKVVDKANELSSGKTSGGGLVGDLAAVEQKISLYENFLKKAETAAPGSMYRLGPEATQEAREKLQKLQEQAAKLKESIALVEEEEAKDKGIESLQDLAPGRDLSKIMQKQIEEYEESLRIYLETDQKLQDQIAKLEAEGEIKKAEDLKKIREQNHEANLEALGKYADERQNFLDAVAKIEVKNNDKKLKVKEEAEEKARQGDIAAWGAYYEARQEQDDENAKLIAEHNKKTARETEDRWEATSSIVGGAFQSGLFDLFKSRTTSFKDKWKEFCDFMQDSFLRALATMASNYVVFGDILGQQKGQSGGLMGLLGGLLRGTGGSTGAYASVDWASSSWAMSTASVFHGGGVAGKEGKKFWEIAPRFHTGIGPDEIAAVLKRDETVFTPGQTKALGLMAKGGGQTVNIYPVIGPNVDAASFMDLCRRSPGAIGQVIIDDLNRAGGIRDAVMKALGR